MANTYLFKGESYSLTNELGIAFSDNFSSAIDAIFANPKRLIKFLKRTDKELAKKVVEDLAYSKYKNNAVTFIIYHLCEDHRVVINGNNFSFNQFCQEIKNTQEPSKAIMVFLEDFGISKTYAHDVNQPDFTDDMYTVEKNIKDFFALEFLKNYDERNTFESPEALIPNVVNNDECFRHASVLFNNEKFQLILAYQYGLKTVLAMRTSSLPIFEGIKLIANEFDINDLTKLITDTFYWWLLDNYEKYLYFKTAKPVCDNFFNILKLKKQYDKNPSLQKLADLSKVLYENYIQFANEFAKGYIKVKNKYSTEDYILDKPYCDTVICIDYMKDHIVKLTGDSTDEDEPVKTEKLEECPVVDTPKEILTSVASVKEVSDKNCRKQEKTIKKLKRYSLHLCLFGLLLALLGLFVFLTNKVEYINNLIPFDFYEINDLYTYVFFGAFGFSLILSIFLRARITKTEAAMNDFMLLRNLRAKKEPLTSVQEKNYNAIVKKEAKINRRAFRRHFILSTLMLVCLAFLGVYVGIQIGAYLKNTLNIDVTAGFEKNPYIYLGAAPGFALLYGLIRKRKGYFTVLLFVIIGIGSVVGLAYFIK